LENPRRVILSVLVMLSLISSGFALLQLVPAASAQTPTAPSRIDQDRSRATAQSPQSATTATSVSAAEVIGVKNTVSISDISVDGGGTCLRFVPNASCFSIQQNFVVIVPSQDGSQTAYWIQNLVVIGDGAVGCPGYGAYSALEVFNFDLSSLTVGSLLNYPTPIFASCISLQDPITLTSVISGGELVASSSSGSVSVGSATCPLPATIECLGASSASGSYIYAGGLSTFEAPELDIVGPVARAQAVFSTPTSGTVQSEVELADSGWTSTVTQSPISHSSTGETSQNLQWSTSASECTTSPCTASFEYSQGGGGQGVIYLPTGYLSSVVFDASPIDGALLVSPSSQVLSVTQGGAGPGCTGGVSTTVTEGQLPYFTSAPSGTDVCYSYVSPIDSILPYGGEQYYWSSLAGTGSASGQSGQSGEFTLASTSSVAAAYITVDSLVILVDSPVNLLVTDPGGQQSGFVSNGSETDQIPGAALVGPCSLQSDQLVSVTIPNPVVGQYQVTVFPSCSSPTGSSYLIDVQGSAGAETYTGTADQGGGAQGIFVLLTPSGQVMVSTSAFTSTSSSSTASASFTSSTSSGSSSSSFPPSYLTMVAAVASLGVLILMRGRGERSQFRR
jgi:hypothetical protein